MNQTMEIYMARKKRVPGYYNPDSNRIFDCGVTDDSLGDSRLNKAHIERKRDPPPPHPREPERRNCPHPWHSRFLRHNVRILNEPICSIATTETDTEQNDWWPSDVGEAPLVKPPFTKCTTQRSDYQGSKPLKRTSRHTSNPKVNPASGILPVTTPKKEKDPGDILLEKISYTHNFDSRSDPSEPIRGKLHGSFVWDNVITNPAGKQVIASPWTKRDITNSGTLVTCPSNKENNIDTTDAPIKNTSTAEPSTIPAINGLPPPQ